MNRGELMSTKKRVQIRNGTAEFLTFAYQSKGDGMENIYAEGKLDEVSTTEDFSALEYGVNIFSRFYLSFMICLIHLGQQGQSPLLPQFPLILRGRHIRALLKLSIKIRHAVET